MTWNWPLLILLTTALTLSAEALLLLLLLTTLLNLEPHLPSQAQPLRLLASPAYKLASLQPIEPILLPSL